VNEAALLATRRAAAEISIEDFTAAMERIVAGLEKKNRVLNPRERTIVAYHEMGHALVAAAIPGSDPVHKISIIPRGIGALGYTLQRPTEVVESILETEGLSKKNIALYIFHQANLRIVEAVASRLELESSRIYGNIERYGNTTAAAVPISLSEAIIEGRVRESDLIMLASFGSGYTWADILLRWLDPDQNQD